MTTPEPPATDTPGDSPPPRRRRRLGWRVLGIGLLLLVVALGVGRAMLPSAVRWYVNRTLDQSPMYDGRIEGVRIRLYRGAYSISNVQLIKTTGNVPVPLFAADRVDLAVEWGALLHGKIVGQVAIEGAELNFVDGGTDDDAGAADQTGAGGPWLEMIQDLFPFDINRVTVRNSSIHFRTYRGAEPVDVYLGSLEASVANLTNVRDEVTPLVTTVEATAKAMGEAPFEFNMQLDPFSYRPTFHVTSRLLNLDVTELNDFTREYGAFDFEHGWFDLVLEMDAKEGRLEGYVKPLFRDLRVLALPEDLEESNPLQVFWEALVGGATGLLKNQPRDQFGTIIPFTGDLSSPDTNLLAILAGVLRNAFIRAYLPQLQETGDPPAGLEFGTPTFEDAITTGDGA